jgi:AcrR family transcriptional regulator
VSPTPARTSGTAIIATAAALLEADGLEAVTMAAVAEQVGVRAPSLYKHVADRSALIVAVADGAVADLGVAMAAAAGASGTTEARLRHVATAFRVFARSRPRATALVFAGLGTEHQPSVAAAQAAVAPLLTLTAELAGPVRALEAARAMTAFAYGFAAMEAGAAFRFGGSVDAAWEAGLEALIRGLGA